MKQPSKICKACGAEFVGYTKYCSKYCASNYVPLGCPKADRPGILKHYMIQGIVQSNRCAICDVEFEGVRGRKAPARDHNHTNGQWRGILCNPCNLALGNFKDDIELLKKATQYLIEWAS